VSGLGSPTYDVAAARRSSRNFYLWDAMGGAAMVGFGLALAQPSRRVLVVTGDGEMLMGLGSPGNKSVCRAAGQSDHCRESTISITVKPHATRHTDARRWPRLGAKLWPTIAGPRSSIGPPAHRGGPTFLAIKRVAAPMTAGIQPTGRILQEVVRGQAAIDAAWGSACRFYRNADWRSRQ